MKEKTELKRPVGINILALLFLMAPVGNLLLSFAGSGMPDWYTPANLLQSLQSVSPLDWLWLSLLVITGLLLIKPTKGSWSLAIFTLFLVLGINSYRLFTAEGQDLTFLRWQVMTSSLTTAGVLLMAFYYRFPYLDRRTRWFIPAAQRYIICTPVEIVAQDIFKGETESVSISGIRVKLREDMGNIVNEIRYVDVILPDVKNMKIKAQVIEYADNVLRLKFKELHGKELDDLKDWLKAQDETSTN